MRPCLLLLPVFALLAAVEPGGGAALGKSLPPGGANAPALAPPPALVGQTQEVKVPGPAGAWTVRLPAGRYEAPPGGAPNHSVPGPVIAIQGPDATSPWRGHGYLETWVACLGYEASITDRPATGSQWVGTITYRFEGGGTYAVTLDAPGDGRLLMTETSTLGPRNLFVFDAAYAWQPQAGFVVDAAGAHHNFFYLPCHYDKVEAGLRYADLTGDGRATAPAGVALVSTLAGQAAPMVAGLWCRDLAAWENGGAMGIQLWQRRQLPGDPASRHFLGPETKSDGTPNPHTAALIGTSRYEGHVTIESAIGKGSRRTAWTCYALPAETAAIPTPFAAAVKPGVAP
jgi:hypothetical protein